ncbi:hypothetical protein NUW58_g7270 [Xylaria curta]|uniref:Uncharacterized protein n=1 Tax=Xylaria curta TaxID=42375 RepID=A0ACC1NKY7_9PEZI|nr:hypothetical protein NUW58_g7270 [Xylaria curta]
MPSDVYTIVWGTVVFIANWLLAHTWPGKSFKRILRLEIPRSPLPAECCPGCCSLQGDQVHEIRTLRLVLEKHCGETPVRQKELAEAMSSAIVAALHDVSDSDHALARELMRENLALKRELSTLQPIQSLRVEVKELGDRLGELVDRVDGLRSGPRQSSDGANPGERRNSL